jgi:hypothetical protein
MHRILVFGACAAAFLPGSTVAADRVPDLLNDRFQATLGAFLLSSEPIIQLDGTVRTGDRVDWEQRFGRMDADRFRFEALWRFAERHKIRATAFSYSRERAKILDESIVWGDETYPVDAAVRTEFSFAVLELEYEYAFVHRENFELSASLGFHYTQVDAALDASADLSNGTLSEDLSDSAALHAPLPLIGLAGVWSLSHDFWLDLSAQYFALSIDGYEGHLQSYRASLTWQPEPWFGIGVGYRAFWMDADAENDDFLGVLDWTLGGPIVFYRASF